MVWAWGKLEAVIETGWCENLQRYDTARAEVVTRFSNEIEKSENVFYKFVARLISSGRDPEFQ